MPKVSILTASYNYSSYIGQTIESVMNQNFSDWEMIVVDDGSKDNSIEVISSYVKKDSRIKLVTHLNNENRGLIESLKLGISQAKGEYIVFLESDDYIREDYLNVKLSIFDKYNDVGLIYNNIETFGMKQKLKRKLYFIELCKYWEKNNYPHRISNLFYFKNYIPTFSCVMLRKELLYDINWNSPITSVVDWWLWAQLSVKTGFYFIQDKLTYWRLHKDSYLNISRKDNFEIFFQFLEKLYDILPPIKPINTKFKFVIKQIMSSFKYKKNMLKNIRHIFKGSIITFSEKNK